MLAFCQHNTLAYYAFHYAGIFNAGLLWLSFLLGDLTLAQGVSNRAKLPRDFKIFKDFEIIRDLRF